MTTNEEQEKIAQGGLGNELRALLVSAWELGLDGQIYEIVVSERVERRICEAMRTYQDTRLAETTNGKVIGTPWGSFLLKTKEIL